MKQHSMLRGCYMTINITKKLRKQFKISEKFFSTRHLVIVVVVTKLVAD